MRPNMNLADDTGPAFRVGYYKLVVPTQCCIKGPRAGLRFSDTAIRSEFICFSLGRFGGGINPARKGLLALRKVSTANTPNIESPNLTICYALRIVCFCVFFFRFVNINKKFIVFGRTLCAIDSVKYQICYKFVCGFVKLKCGYSRNFDNDCERDL